MNVTISHLNVFPVKSARGLSIDSTILLDTGLTGDREWMVVDPDGNFVTQRQHPALAKIAVAMSNEGINLQVGSTKLQLNKVDIQTTASPRTVTVWDQRVDAWDCGDAAAEFLSETMGENRDRKLRLVLKRDSRKLSKRNGTVHFETYFADGYPFLITAEESLEELQRQMAARGVVSPENYTMSRFRPNIVIRGLPPFTEDRIDTLSLPTGAVLQLVKPCIRCVIIMRDQITGKKSLEPMETLRLFRQNANQDLSFGQNAVLTEGNDTVIAVGQKLTVTMKSEQKF